MQSVGCLYMVANCIAFSDCPDMYICAKFCIYIMWAVDIKKICIFLTVVLLPLIKYEEPAYATIYDMIISQFLAIMLGK